MASPHLGPEEVASAALRAFAALPERGKPRTEEWTVLAAFVAEDEPAPGHSRYRAVALATGNKCVGRAALAAAAAAGVAGGLLRDSHAEVLARRALLKLLYDELQLLEDEEEAPLGAGIVPQDARCSSGGSPRRRTFRLRRGVKLHMYVSEAPCGDAALFRLSSGGVNFTGAKLVEATTAAAGAVAESSRGEGQGEVKGEGGGSEGSSSSSRHPGDPFASGNAAAAAPAAAVGQREPGPQLLGAWRLKSGRSDLREGDRTLSMCCSDKLARWALLGLQGSLLARWLPRPLPLASLVVSADPRAASHGALLAALQRAVPGRVAAARAEARRAGAAVAGAAAEPADDVCALPAVHVVACAFAASLQARLAALATGGAVTVHPATDDSTVAAATMPVGSLGLKAEGGDDDEPRQKKRRRKLGGDTSAGPVPSGLCCNWVAALPLRAAPCKRPMPRPPPSAQQAAAEEEEAGSAAATAVASASAVVVQGVPGEALLGEVEVTVGASGRRQGAATKGPAAAAPATRSRLCKERLFEHWRTLATAEQRGADETSVAADTAATTVAAAEESLLPATYLACKQAGGHGRRALVAGAAPLLAQWVCSPAEYNCFELASVP
jgi:hypothetical protein